MMKKNHAPLGRCPFCGHKDVTIIRPNTDSYAVFCPGCNAGGSHEQRKYDAIDVWNAVANRRI